MLELHFIESPLHKGFYKPANADAKTAFKMHGLHLHTDYAMPSSAFLEACNEWNMKIYTRQEGESLSQAKCLNPKFAYL